MVANNMDQTSSVAHKRGNTLLIAVVIAAVVGGLVLVAIGSVFVNAVDKRVQERRDLAKVEAAYVDFSVENEHESTLIKRQLAGENVDDELAALQQKRMERMQSLEGQVNGDIKKLMGISMLLVGELNAAVEPLDALIDEFADAGGVHADFMQDPDHREKMRAMSDELITVSQRLLATAQGLPQRIQAECDEAGLDAVTTAEYKREFLKNACMDELVAKNRKSVEVWQSIHALVVWMSDPENPWEWNANTQQIEFMTDEKVDAYNALVDKMQADIDEEERLMLAFFQAKNGR